MIALLLSIAMASDRPLDGWKCSIKQIKNVTAQYDACVKSSFINSYCYEVAVKAHCEKIKENK